MKKIIIVSMMLLVLLLSACSSESPNSTQAYSVSHSHRIIFRTEEELREVLDAAKQSDDKFDAFIAKKSNIYSYNQIRNKSDIEKLSALFQTVGTPVVINKDQDYSYSCLYKPDEMIYDIAYVMNGVRYRFFYEPFEDFAAFNKRIIAKYTLDGASLTMYQLKDDNVGNKRMFAQIYANGYAIQVIVYYKDINAVDFTSFDWSTEMQYIS